MYANASGSPQSALRNTSDLSTYNNGFWDLFERFRAFVERRTVLSTFQTLDAARSLTLLSRRTDRSQKGESVDTMIEAEGGSAARVFAAAHSSVSISSTPSHAVQDEGTVGYATNQAALNMLCEVGRLHQVAANGRAPVPRGVWSEFRGWQGEACGIEMNARCCFPVDQEDALVFQFHIKSILNPEEETRVLNYSISNYQFNLTRGRFFSGGFRWLEACYEALVEDDLQLRSWFQQWGFHEEEQLSSLLRQLGQMMCHMKLIFEPRKSEEEGERVES
jgi:hypothetical protein